MRFHLTQSSVTYSSPQAANTLTYTLPSSDYIRCDSRVEFASTTNGGCVHTDFTLKFTLYRSEVPEVAAHIDAAQETLIGRPGSIFGNALYRLTEYYDPVAFKANKDRTLVVATCQDKFGPPQAGMDCDEYPFASTYEGGFGWDPRLPNKNFSVRYVNFSQNRSAGGQLAAWLTANRVLDGQFGDGGAPILDPFYVVITNSRPLPR
jgi:hypothetical protein